MQYSTASLLTFSVLEAKYPSLQIYFLKFQIDFN
jgi:hypothetical protein